MGTFEVDDVRISADHFIDGRRVPSLRTFPDTSPIDESTLGALSAGGPAEVEAAVDAAQRAFPAWAAAGPEERGRRLRRLADLVDRHVDALAIVETMDNGSLLEAGRRRVMKRAAANLRFFAEYATALRGREWTTEGADADNLVRYEPAGVTAVITPWNAPLMLATWRVGPALAAGNTVVLKPPEWAPLTASLLADLASEAELPRGVLNVVQGTGAEAGAALAAHPGVRRIAFTGSPETGREVARSAARSLVPVSFEMGGKSALVVFGDADLHLALKTAVGQYDNAGQVCLAGTRLLVERTVAAEFLQRLREAADRIVVGDPRRTDTAVGPLITRRHLERVAAFVERAKAEAELVYGGHVREDVGGLYYAPTLFTDVQEGAEILQKEVFGPVLTFQTFAGEEQAVEMANGTSYGLAATVFTRDEARARRVSGALVAGTVWVNCFFVRDLEAPFGGARASGIGREGGIWSFDFYCDVKNVCRRKGTFS